MLCKFQAIMMNVALFFNAKFLPDRFCFFVLEKSSLSSDFFTPASKFLRDLNCSHSEIKFVARIKAVVSA